MEGLGPKDESRATKGENGERNMFGASSRREELLSWDHCPASGRATWLMASCSGVTNQHECGSGAHFPDRIYIELPLQYP